eukprot:2857064-Ditylum_brightwellii.AAC.1
MEEVEKDTMEDETLQAEINEREGHVNVLLPTNESTNPPHSIEDQITHIEQEMDQVYRTRICSGLITKKQRTLVPQKFQGFSNTTTTAKIQQKGKCNRLHQQQQRKKFTTIEETPKETTKKGQRYFTPTLANNIAASMKERGTNIPKYICLQGQVYHQNRPKVKILLNSPI